MKLFVLLVLVGACQGNDRDTPHPATGSSAAPAPAVTPTRPGPDLDICAIGVSALANVTCASPENVKDIQRANKSLLGIVDTIHQASGTDTRQLQMICAQLLLGLERDALNAHCKLAFGDDQRKAITAALDAWYAQRTPVTPTGDAASDAVIARVVAARDAMCACVDMDCLTRIDKQLDTLGSLPATAPKAAKDLGSSLLDDVGRCESKIRTAATP